MMKKGVLLTLLVLAGGMAGAISYGALRWKEETNNLRNRLAAGRIAVRPRVVDFAELHGLPAPVQKYFKMVLNDGQSMIAAARVEHHGTFNMGRGQDGWKPFTSGQQVVARRPGFDWNGRVSMMPGIPVYVHDAYVAGKGILHAAVLGLFTVADMQGGKDVAEGELMRFLAEAAWYPTALLPSQGVQWTPLDDRSAHATLVDGDNKITMLFSFDEQGLIQSVGTPSRGRTVGDRIVPTPWEGRFWNYERRNGMLVPVSGEVAWLLPEGRQPYWRGTIQSLEYEFAL